MGNKIFPKTVFFLLAGACVLLLFYQYFVHRAVTSKEVSFVDASDRLKHYNWSSLIDTPNGSGVCALDANNDGLQDLFFPGLGDFNINLTKLSGYQSGNRLYLNQGNDKANIPEFKEVSEESKVRNVGKMGVGCVVADYNNDGWEDILVTNATKGAYYAAYGSWNSSGGQRFFPPDFFPTDKTDGKYDFPNEGGVTLFQNLGLDHGVPKFTDVTLNAGLTRGGNGTSASFADVNNDGFVDLFVSNYSDYDYVGFSFMHFAGQFNVLYRNNGNGTFSDVTKEANVAGESEFVYTLQGQKQFGYDKNLKDSKGRVVGDPAGNTLACAFFDYNDDGLVDLVTADDIPGRIRLYKNLGNFKFAQVSDENDMGTAGAWMGIAIGDINSDGTQDFFATNFGGPWGAQYRVGSKETFMMDI
ncbi:MAG TPA: VCBS repeat-containing protein, partial [Patescibacteria group bacterium]|nr:VCBS repeat-containing protein [Patescibacteria group bacterium]